MAIRAEVDGVGVLEFPDGTDPAVVQMTVKRVLARGTPEQRRSAVYRGDAPPERHPMSSIAHGALDTSEAVAQMVSRGATALGLPPGSDYPFVASPDIVAKSAAKAREDVNRNLGEPNAQGIDIPRAATSGVLAMPYAGSVGTAPTMLGRAGQAARAGAVQGVLQPVADGEGKDFGQKKAFQATTGALFGGGAQPALEFGAQGLSALANSAVNRAGGAMRDTTEQAAAQIANSLLSKQGIALDQLEQGVQQSIIRDVQEALKKYGGVNAAALGRQADFKSLDINPLQPWVTRDPVQWGQYKNLEGARDAGEPLVRARAELDSKLIGRLESQRGPPAGDAYQAGTAAGNFLASRHKQMRDQVTGLYDQFRATAPNVAADPKRLVNTILDGVEGDALGDFLSPGLRNLVNDFATGKRPTTPDSLYRAQQVANAEIRKGGNEGRAASYVARGIDNELEQMGRDMSAVGPEMAQASDLLKQARAAHKSLKIQEETIPALRDVAEGKFAAEDFFNRYILGADVREVAAMWQNAGSQELKQSARSQLIDYLKKKAAGAGSDDGAVFKQGQFSEALDSPGMTQKIRIILGDKGLSEVQRIQRAGEAAIRTPSGTRYNTSGSAIEMMNLLRRSAGVPVLGPMVTEPASKFLTQTQANGLTKPASLGAGLLDPFYEELLRRSREGAGLLSPLLGGAVASDFSR